MNEWQPIETAPRDGTSIIAWSADYSGPFMVRWTDGGYGYLGWHDEYGEREDPAKHNAHEPTHWQPLPEPPK